MTIQVSHFIDHDEILSLIDLFSDPWLFTGALDELYGETRDTVRRLIETNGLADLAPEESVPRLLSLLDEQASQFLREAGGLNACFFALIGSEVLSRGHRAGQVDFWKASSHLNALNHLGKVAAANTSGGGSEEFPKALIRAYALAERREFVQHNADVCRANDLRIPLAELAHRAVEPPDFEAHWSALADSFHVYAEYEICGPFAAQLQNEIDRKGAAPFKSLNSIVLEELGFPLGQLGLVLRVITISEDKGALILLINNSFFGIVGDGESTKALVDSFSWTPGHPKGWDLNFRPFIKVLVGGEEHSFTGPLIAGAALTSFFNVVKQNAFWSKYVGEDRVADVSRKNAPMQQHSSDELCFKVADVLTAHGFVTPLSGGIPRINVKSFKIGDKTVKMETKIGDIDVLAGEKSSGDIFVVECKLFRAGITPREFHDVDAQKAIEALSRVRGRHAWVEANKDDIRSLLGLPAGGRVTSLVITARPNFMATQVNDSQMVMLDFAGLISRYPPR